MIGQYFFRRHAGAELSQYQLDGDSRSANDRLAVHDLGVHLDPCVGHQPSLARNGCAMAVYRTTAPMV